MPLGAEHVKPAGGDDLLLELRDLGAHLGFLGLALLARLHGAECVADAHIGVAAELDVGAAAGHVGRDGDGARGAGLRDDEGLLLVEARIEDREQSRGTPAFACRRIERLGGLFGSAKSMSLKPCVFITSASASDFSIEVVPTRRGLALRMRLLDLAHHRAGALFAGAIDFVVDGPGASTETLVGTSTTSRACRSP